MQNLFSTLFPRGSHWEWRGKKIWLREEHRPVTVLNTKTERGLNVNDAEYRILVRFYTSSEQTKLINQKNTNWILYTVRSLQMFI